MPLANLNPPKLNRSTGGDDWGALERELEEIADLLLSNEDKAR